MAYRPPLPPFPRGPPRRSVPAARTNGLWRRWIGPGALFGLCLSFLGLLITLLEIARLFSGIDNRGCFNETKLYAIYQNIYNAPFADPLKSNGFVFGDYLPIFHPYVWPWTRPGILFGLVAMFTGIIGLISARRQSYSSIMTFWACSLLTFFLLIFLIAYYSVAIHYYNRNITCNVETGQTKDSRFFKNGRGLAISILVFSLLASLLTCCALMAAAVALSLGKRKGGPIPRGRAIGRPVPVPVRVPGYPRPYLR